MFIQPTSPRNPTKLQQLSLTEMNNNSKNLPVLRILWNLRGRIQFGGASHLTSFTPPPHSAASTRSQKSREAAWEEGRIRTSMWKKGGCSSRIKQTIRLQELSEHSRTSQPPAWLCRKILSIEPPRIEARRISSTSAEVLESSLHRPLFYILFRLAQSSRSFFFLSSSPS